MADLVNIILAGALAFAALGIILATVRLVIGPCAATRAISLDTLTLITLPVMSGVAVLTQRAIYLDVVLVYALLSFVGVISLARYFDRGI